MNNIHPWFNEAWQILTQYKQLERIPSGLLLSGPSGIGKVSFSTDYAQYILCQGNHETACGTCRSCQLYQVGNHPDLIQVSPEEGSSLIKIDQIRDLVEALGKTPGLGGYQVAIISKAETMNRAAANALLKTLEEPQGRVVILLICDRPTLVPATIRSRCQHIKLPLPSRTLSEGWLKPHIANEVEAQTYLSIADNLPMKALAYSKSNKLELRDTLITALENVQSLRQEPTQIAANYLEEPKDTLELLMTVVLDMIKIKLTTKESLQHHDKLNRLEEIAKVLPTEQLFLFLDKIKEAYRALSNNQNVNLQLLMEKIFISWRYHHDVS